MKAQTWVAGLLAVCVASQADAQACVGLPDSPQNLTVAAAFPDGAKQFGARFGLAGTSAFGGANVAYASINDTDLSAVSFGADAGLVVPVGTRGASLCPVVSADYINGPNEGRLKVNSINASGGLAIGGAIAVNPEFAVLPFASASVLYVRTRASFDGESDSLSDTGGQIAAGFGLRFNRTLVLTPVVSIPVGFDDSSTTFGVRASIGFGTR